ncbi:hypothetical protein [Azohydromonas aeria]|uniref:hypothetical protein n=1 Tax=Azohydromonas aeria TaxID=2590212 RepID=UPI0012F9E65F|nr:hypothetical protein [Azohydromonas aeria]
MTLTMTCSSYDADRLTPGADVHKAERAKKAPARGLNQIWDVEAAAGEETSRVGILRSDCGCSRQWQRKLTFDAQSPMPGRASSRGPGSDDPGTAHSSEASP